ncbi:MAG TPA: hypothetical protein VMY35_19935 [Phycisphaerae bacterium]|nr:hypothetical protein [Phycisphaerae bacterium]
MTPTPISERRVQRWLWLRMRSSCKVVMPNYTPPQWWECDVFSITAVGYFTEYEIKLSLSDFRADAKKGERWYGGETKHMLLAQGSECGPSRFWYVLPEGMVTPKEVPSWAGLLVFKGGSWFHIEKMAPRLHKQKCTIEFEHLAYRSAYMRFWELWK